MSDGTAILSLTLGGILVQVVVCVFSATLAHGGWVVYQGAMSGVGLVMLGLGDWAQRRERNVTLRRA